MGKAIDKLKCGGKPSHRGGGKTGSYQTGGKIGDGPKPRKNILLPGTELTEHQDVVTMSDVERVKRLRGHQGKLTKAFHQRYPKVPVQDILKEIGSREPHFSKRDVPQVGEELTGSFGDLFLEPEEITNILGEGPSKEYFDLVQSGRTAGAGETGPQRFGFRNMITPQYRGGLEDAGPYQYLEEKTSIPGLQEGGGIGMDHALKTIFGDSADLENMSEDQKAGMISKLRSGADGEAGIGSAISVGTDLAGDVVGGVQNKIASGYDDPREDPTETLKKTQSVGVAGDILKSTGKGAAAGAMFGPVGAIVGGGIGLLSSGVKAILGSGERKEQREELQNAWAGNWADKYFAGKKSFVTGGLVTGKGGPKSDAITMTAQDGSFVAPAENSAAAMELGREYLGWNEDTQAKRNNGGSKIKISDGEVFFNPDEAAHLQAIGYDLNKLAPNAGPDKKFQEGGWKYDEDKGWVISEKGDIAYDAQGNEYKKGTSGELEIVNENTTWGSDIFGKNAPKSAIAPAEGKTTIGDVGRKAAEFIPELASAVQIAGAIKGLKESGKRPDLIISHRLKSLARDTRNAAAYGLEPNVRNAYARDIERTRRDVMNKIVGRGGSAGQVTNSLQKLTTQTLEQKAQIPIMEQEMKLRKTSINAQIEQGLATMEFDKSKIESQLWHEYQKDWGNMLMSGIGNMIGARQYKSHLDYIKSVGGTTPSFSEIQKSTT